ncbi:MAG: twin-arginine translocation signal domain-containing protein [Kiritimatiellaeota bacterium]|nr:twin-arginine translocation signal domain-containing protein [Kiritimatiellota bacterium]
MAENIGRRGFLKRSLAAGGAALALGSHEEKALGAEISAAKPAAPAAANVPPLALPKGKIKDLEISRVICGGNLIGGWAHSRDLIYVSPLIKAYHTDDKVIETFQLAERRGINTALTNPASNRVINAYRKAGGKMQWISDCAAGSLKDSIKSSVDTGADAVYVQGGICDKMVKTGQMKELEGVMSFMKDLGAPFGLGAHSLETVRQCVQAGFEPDFWVKTLHKAEYWSATPESGRHAFDEIDGNKKDHDLHHDNMWCINAKETIEYMAKLNKPWIAFKTLAAGAIHPREAFQWCFENGADFLCVGMFDFQIVENTEIAAKALQVVTQKGRPRPWIA